jgi:hypothetical protein
MEGETLRELAKALAKAQSEIKAAKMDSTNPFFKSKNADLSSVWESCRGPLTKNGLSIIQRPDATDGNTISLTTIILHESGEFISGTLVMKPVKNDPQGLGSCLTYARRYALASMVGICSEEDDDGNRASTANQAQEEKPASPPAEEKGEYTADKPDEPGKTRIFHGLINAYEEPKAGRSGKLGPAHIMMEGEKLCTFDKDIAASLLESFHAKDTVRVFCDREVNGKYINYSITGFEVEGA